MSQEALIRWMEQVEYEKWATELEYEAWAAELTKKWEMQQTRNSAQFNLATRSEGNSNHDWIPDGMQLWEHQSSSNAENIKSSSKNPVKRKHDDMLDTYVECSKSDVDKAVEDQKVEEQLSLLKIREVEAFDKAFKDWQHRAKEFSADFRTSLNVTFKPEISSTRQFHDLLEAMGVNIIAQKKGESLPQDLSCPFATVAGDASQPALIVTYKKAPGEQKITLQANLRQRTLTAKARRGALEGQMERFIGFFGSVFQITSSAPAKKTSSAEAPNSGLSIRALILMSASKSV
ncbi:unnamed protein product [Symbiodinium natans]|uniref:Uncharacterized protein n=1 Tax=Symbiodinium natans TaxID=878477 RepID=A0A812K7X5_9DINO|nr:unnamed protein product [Symbiodinium natans]